MTEVTLSPELERFVSEAVTSGRYRDVSEIVGAGLALLREIEGERAAFIESLEAAEAESEREGFHSIDEVHEELSARIPLAGRGGR